MNLTATLPSSEVRNAINYGQKKELCSTWNLVAYPAGLDRRGSPLFYVTARTYMARHSDGASPVYASIWLNRAPRCSGSGKASGYGYHKESAAIDGAIESAGIKLSRHIDGVGESAIRDALVAITVAMGADPETVLVVEN